MTEHRREIEAIFGAALDAVRADNAVRRQLELQDNGRLRVGDARIEIPPLGVYAIAIGKASVTMVEAAAERLGERFTAGLAVTKAEEPAGDERVMTLLGSHPVPDERSLAAGEAVLRFAGDVPDGALVVCLISGGGSALVESLRDGVNLDRLRDVTSSLLRAGASIHELNAVRSRLSRIKAGGLLAALSHVQLVNVIVSDVIGDDLQTIASGPTVPSHGGDAEAVMGRYGIAGPIPDAAVGKPESRPLTIVVANLSTALEAAAKEATARGYAPVILTQSLDGEAREAGKLIAALLADSAAGMLSLGGRACLLAGGETTVTVRGSGMGGRNTEAALAAAIRLEGVSDTALGFLATDGDDGATGVAGAIVDGQTITVARRMEAVDALERNDSFTFLRGRDAQVVTGPTGTNVNDLVIGLIG